MTKITKTKDIGPRNYSLVSIVASPGTVLALTMGMNSLWSVAEKDGIIEATGEIVYVQGDKLTILVDQKTNLYIKKTFSSLLGKDPVSGEINYEKFNSGINHGTTTVLDMPAQKMKINAINQDYTQRVK